MAGRAESHGRVRPRPTGCGKVAAMSGIYDKAKPHGRRTRRPYGLTGIGIYEFAPQFAAGRTAGSRPRPTEQGWVDAATACSRQDKIARAAYRPPLRPNGKQVCRARVLTAPGSAAAGREFAGNAKPRGGGETPPYRKRERGCNTARSRQDKIARAAYMPPLRPNIHLQFTVFVCNLRKVVAPAREGGRGFRTGARMSGSGRHGPGLG